jgi:hypothetical protein
MRLALFPLGKKYGPDLGDRWGTGKIGAASER